MNILYEDNHLIAVYKPAGILVQGDASGEQTLMDEVKAYIKKTYHKPGNVFLGLLHRLDKVTSGIILFAKTSKGASRLSKQFRERTIQKEYHAIVEGIVEQKSGTLIHYLKKNDAQQKMDVFKTDILGSQRAELDFVVVQHNKHNTLLKIILKTGRKHQIRAQLSTIGYPVVGDVKYGAHIKLPDRSIRLCATSLSFFTATGEQTQELHIAIPPSWMS